MLRVEQNPALEMDILKDLDASLGDAAAEAAYILTGKLEAGNDRTGTHWPEDPRRASAHGEYPQEQRSSLINSVDYKKSKLAEWLVGFFGENQFKLNRLEFGLDQAADGQSTGSGKRKGQRRPLYMLFQGRDKKSTSAAMAKAIEERVR